MVLLDFWTPSHPSSIRTILQVQRLVDELKPNEPVVVLGMNTDRNERDTQFVADALKIKFPVLSAEGLAEKYHIQDYPALVIIDQEGKIADVQIGYSPTLHENLSTTIEGLLRKGRNK